MHHQVPPYPVVASIRDVQEATSRVSDESWVPHTTTYQQSRKELQNMLVELERRQKELDTLHKERDDMVQAMHGKHLREEVGWTAL